VNELLNRRAEIADIVDVNLLAAERAPHLGFASYVVSAPTPFLPRRVRALTTTGDDRGGGVGRRPPAFARGACLRAELTR